MKHFHTNQHTPWGALAVYVLKRDDSLGMFIDHHELNKVAINNKYLMLCIDDLVD